MALQISISNAIGARAVAGGGGIDPDAQAFITASGITDATQQSAINQLVVDLKGYNIWTKMKALYPFVGGTAAQHKWNLKDPRDLDAAFRLVFNGGWTHSATGATPNGTNAFANTYFNPIAQSSALQSFSLSFYSRTNSNAGNAFDIGSATVWGSGYQATTIATKYNNNNTFIGIASSYTQNAENDSRGFYLAGTNGSTTRILYKNGVNTFSGTSAQDGFANQRLYIGAINDNGLDNARSNKQTAFASIGEGLTPTQAANFYTAVQAFQTTLGRSIGTQTVSDADAQAFVTNAGIVDQVEANAVNNLVIGLKADGLWSKMKALYPFVGGTAATHKWNLKDPRDLDAAFRIFWNGGVTHSSNGVQFGGVNGWGNTYLVAQGTLGLNSTHVSVYSRTNVDITAPSIGNVTGGASSEVSMWLRSGGSSFLRVNNPTVSSTANTDSRGLFIGNRNSSTQINLSIRGTQTTFSQNSNSLLTTVMQLGGVNPNFFDTKQLAFASIGDGLTSQNMTDLTTAVNAFQVTLSRNV